MSRSREIRIPRRNDSSLAAVFPQSWNSRQRSWIVDLTNEDVADILALLDSLPYDSLDIETPRFRLTLRRAPGGGWTEESQVLAEPIQVKPAPNGTAAASAATSGTSEIPGRAADAAPPGEADGGANGLSVVAAPLPGTFYRAPRPGADPFVEIGDAVTPDTVVAIVETMKLMNSVHAGTAGRVARVCLENGEFAPLGTALLLIEPAT
jgi:acetyl-CoA carboxylase biotin carboxyl carrier protein